MDDTLYALKYMLGGSRHGKSWAHAAMYGMGAEKMLKPCEQEIIHKRKNWRPWNDLTSRQ